MGTSASRQSQPELSDALCALRLFTQMTKKAGLSILCKIDALVTHVFQDREERNHLESKFGMLKKIFGNHNFKIVLDLLNNFKISKIIIV